MVETVVDSTYKAKSGALNKARALQFCLEEDNNILKDEDWIVHLDEETLLTDSSVRGILNFINSGQHSFGQGIAQSVLTNIVLSPSLQELSPTPTTLLSSPVASNSCKTESAQWRTVSVWRMTSENCVVS